MGGKTSHPINNTYNPQKIKNRENYLEQPETENSITIFNFEEKLRKYNFLASKIKKIKVGLFCDYKLNKINKFVFNNIG